MGFVVLVVYVWVLADLCVYLVQWVNLVLYQFLYILIPFNPEIDQKSKHTIRIHTNPLLLIVIPLIKHKMLLNLKLDPPDQQHGNKSINFIISMLKLLQPKHVMLILFLM